MVLTTAALMTRPSLAQIVNVQPLVGGDEEGFGGHLAAATDWRGGSTKLFTLSGDFSGRYDHGIHHPLLLLQGEYGVQGGERFLNRTLEHLRYRVVVHAPFEMEAFVQHERNEFRRLEVRALGGGGPRLAFRPTAGMSLAVGVAAMAELETLQDDGEIDAGQRTVHARGSTYATLGVSVTDRVMVGQTFYVQPRFDDFADYRVLSDTKAKLAFFKRGDVELAITATLSLAYDARPPAAVSNIDGVRKGALALSF